VEDGVLLFGSRSGAWFALLVFGGIFGVLGAVVARAIRQRAPAVAPSIRCGLGLAFFLGPLALIWATSLNGFYELEMRGSTLTVHYLIGPSREIHLAHVNYVRARPWYRGRWRLVVEEGGREIESATSNRTAVDDAVDRIRASKRGS
jgi:hypothetical protein